MFASCVHTLCRRVPVFGYYRFKRSLKRIALHRIWIVDVARAYNAFVAGDKYSVRNTSIIHTCLTHTQTHTYPHLIPRVLSQAAYIVRRGQYSFRASFINSYLYMSGRMFYLYIRHLAGVFGFASHRLVCGVHKEPRSHPGHADIWKYVCFTGAKQAAWTTFPNNTQIWYFGRSSINNKIPSSHFMASSGSLCYLTI